MKIYSKILLLVAITSLLSSCGTVRVRYGAKFKTQNQKKGEFVYEKSYAVGSLQTWCIITGIVYGGACWLYLGLPYNKHEEMVKRDARIKLGTLVGETDLIMYEESIARQNFKDLKEYHSVSIAGKKTVESEAKTRPEDDDRENTSKGFLR